jgi:hypothetical protein
MKRWHGRPPLLHHQSENAFDEFILGLAACVRDGDALVECLVYRYGLEKWHLFQLESNRQKLLLIEHQLRREFEKRDSQRKNRRDDKKNHSAERADIILENLSKIVTDSIILDEDLCDIKLKMQYKNKLDELSLLPKLHASLDLHATISLLIDQAMRRMADLDRELAAHQIFLAGKSSEHYWETILEAARTLPTRASDDHPSER